MVDVPFVSEDFQRAFRNQFPSQHSSGRDLHVSDVVIPVVDFTPTASGASLPTELRFSINRSSVNFKRISTGDVDLCPNTGFYRIICHAASQNTSQNINTYQFKDNATSVTDTVFEQLTAGINTISMMDFNVYVPVGYTFICNVGADLTSTFVVTQLADVNGNLTSPSGYSPQ